MNDRTKAFIINPGWQGFLGMALMTIGFILMPIDIGNYLGGIIIGIMIGRNLAVKALER